MKAVLGCLIVALALGSASQVGAAESEGKNLEPPSGGGELTGGGPRRIPRGVRTDVFSSTDVPKAITDNDTTGITSTLEVVIPSGVPSKISDVNLVLDSLPHTCVPDLHIELESPSGTSISVILSFAENGIFSGLGCPDNFTDTVLDDDAPTSLIAMPLAPPFTGSFNVDHVSVGPSPLAHFDGEEAAGTWTLKVSDRANGDTGSLDAWSLEITHEVFNSYQCFKAKDLKDPKFTPLDDLPIDSGLLNAPIDVKKPSHVCLPADVDGSGVPDEGVAQCCYQSKGPALKPPVPSQVTDDFGALSLGLSKPSLVCQPCSVQTPQ